MIYLLHQTVEQWARQTPDRASFRVPGAGLSYAELDADSNRLARALRERGVARGDRVGILLPRSLDSAVAVYGVLKAGAAFVPLDPTAPPARLARLLEHCGVRHLVTGAACRTLVDRLPNRPEILQSWESFPEAPVEGVNLTEDDLAYIMVTSGSTGDPKGIMHTHRSGLAYARLSAHTYGLGPADRVGNHSPLHFDMATLGYFTAPLTGATTVVVPEAYSKLPASLSQLIDTEQITIWYSVPFALIQLLLRGALEARDLSSLRWVLFGGEPFPVKHLRALMKRLPRARFSNVYGPAEVNQCTYYHLPSEDELPDPVPIGRVWENTEGLILDELDQPAPEGELLIRSATAMLGYWNDPERNRLAFFRKVLEGGREEAFYRTGDLVRLDPSGELVFLGRKDRQVKVRGHRVELDEIEAVLCMHPAVEEAAAFPLQGSQADTGIAAAVTVRESLETKELMAHARQHLPPYAVPSRVDVTDRFPRTGTGKIDRRSLREELVG